MNLAETVCPFMCIKSCLSLLCVSAVGCPRGRVQADFLRP